MGLLTSNRNILAWFCWTSQY